MNLHARNVKLADDVDLTAIARATSGASGADLANIINEGNSTGSQDGQEICYPGGPGRIH